MGRSRRNFLMNQDYQSTTRTRRRRNVTNENQGSSSFCVEQRKNGDDKKALYHCNYCNKDITGKIRIKCGVCSDFDLCVECFSVGAQVSPHESDHSYRVMESHSFPLITPDWNADEEFLLLEGIDMYGVSNWAEVSEHVGTKDLKQCVDHYTIYYLNSSSFPLPDLSNVTPKDKMELLNVAKTRVDKIQDSQPKMIYKGKETISEESEKSLMMGYNSKRHEFEVEYDNEAEELVAEMDFKDNDTKQERELKLRVLRIYAKRLRERERRKDFIKERDLLEENPMEREMSEEEKALCRQYDVFMRFHSKEDHEELLKTVVSEHRMKKRIQDLKDAKAAGCRSTAEADIWIEERKMVQAASNSSRGNHIDEKIIRDTMILLSEYEKRLCGEIGLAPHQYMKMQEVISKGIISGQIKNKVDAHGLFNVHPMLVDRVFDMLVTKKGFAPGFI